MTFPQQMLADAAKERGFTESQAMNALQAAGIVSDNAVQFSDVANADCARATDFIEQAPIQ